MRCKPKFIQLFNQFSFIYFSKYFLLARDEWWLIMEEKKACKAKKILLLILFVVLLANTDFKTPILYPITTVASSLFLLFYSLTSKFLTRIIQTEMLQKEICQNIYILIAISSLFFSHISIIYSENFLGAFASKMNEMDGFFV
jgi:hypothetical protein